MPAKPAPINPVVKHHFEKEGITLESLCVGGNPFDGSEQSDGGQVEADHELDSFLEDEQPE